MIRPSLYVVTSLFEIEFHTSIIFFIHWVHFYSIIDCNYNLSIINFSKFLKKLKYCLRNGISIFVAMQIGVMTTIDKGWREMEQSVFLLPELYDPMPTVHTIIHIYIHFCNYSLTHFRSFLFRKIRKYTTFHDSVSQFGFICI